MKDYLLCKQKHDQTGKNHQGYIFGDMIAVSLGATTIVRPKE
jgi:hypothetical protein